MNHLVTVQVLQGNTSTQKIRKDLTGGTRCCKLEVYFSAKFFSGAQLIWMFREVGNDQSVSDEFMRQSSFSCPQVQQWLVITKVFERIW